MDNFFTIMWLLSCTGAIIEGLRLSKIKHNKNKNSAYKQTKAILITALIISFISLAGIELTVPEIKETNNTNQIISENVNNKKNETKEDVTQIDNTVKDEKDFKENQQAIISSIPSYMNSPYVVINNNIPFFNDNDLLTMSYESYSELDNLGRCGVAIASIGQDLMPTEERGSIGSIKPTGWHTVKYEGIDGNYLYNRCHLIGYQLTAENANEKNLITGTRYMNVQGMLPFENMVADYIKETGKHVLYRVTPIFDGNNLLASGVLMEAKSVEDNGKTIQFNVYCYNVQPGITIDYATGESKGPEYVGSGNFSNSTTSNILPATGTQNSTTSSNTSNNEKTNSYVLNTNTKKFHKSNCRYVNKINDKNREDYNGLRSNLISRGYEACKSCNP